MDRLRHGHLLLLCCGYVWICLICLWHKLHGLPLSKLMWNEWLVCLRGLLLVDNTVRLLFEHRHVLQSKISPCSVYSPILPIIPWGEHSPALYSQVAIVALSESSPKMRKLPTAYPTDPSS